MNKQRRKQIYDVMEKLESIGSILQDILDEEQESFDNMPESLQSSDNGMISEEAQESLNASIEALEEAIGCLEEI